MITWKGGEGAIGRRMTGKGHYDCLSSDDVYAILGGIAGCWASSLSDRRDKLCRDFFPQTTQSIQLHSSSVATP